MNIFNKLKFKKYCKLYSYYFNVEKPSYETINYESLTHKIINQYSEMDDDERIIEELILKNEINSNIKSDYSAFSIVFITFFISMGIEFFKKWLDEPQRYNTIFLFIYIVICLIISILMFNKALNDDKYSIRNGFFNLCLDALNTVNNSEFNSATNYNISFKGTEYHIIVKEIKDDVNN